MAVQSTTGTLNDGALPLIELKQDLAHTMSVARSCFVALLVVNIILSLFNFYLPALVDAIYILNVLIERYRSYLVVSARTNGKRKRLME